jgi:hypothetical protein
MFTRLGSIPARYPFYFGVGVSCAKTSFSDYLVQTVVERKEKVDWKRNAAFAAFGFFYLGGVQYGIYVNLFGRMFPNAAAFAAKPIREKLKDFRGIFNVGSQVCTVCVADECNLELMDCGLLKNRTHTHALTSLFLYFICLFFTGASGSVPAPSNNVLSSILYHKRTHH